MRINRRTFIGSASSASLGLMLSSLDSFASPILNAHMNTTYELIVLATNWGFEGTTDQFCAAAKKEGYDGIEIWWPGDDQKAQQELFTALDKHNLQVGFLCAGWQTDPREHFNTFRSAVDAASENRYRKPLYVNCHSGKDFFTFDQNRTFIEHTIAQSRKTGIPICHETHRGRMMFAANICRQFMEKLPELKLTFDVSHWCNVHESLLADQQETVSMALDKVEHIHARIGHAEGPQVNDPRAPEWNEAVTHHFGWWDKVVDRKKKSGGRMTFLTEFGPADYMPTLPYTRQALSDQWAINVHMMQLLRKRYQ